METDDGFQKQIDARIGRTLCNKYTLEKVLGIGGMASVYRGTHRNGNRVAVKVLHTELSVSKDIRERFLREGYVANKVDHDGAVRVLDDDVSPDGAVFLVMELLEGQTLEELIIERGGVLSPREIVPFMYQLLDVLVAAHAKGVVHRDIKPENLFIERRDGALKVLDFGIARLNDQARQATRTGRVMGTPVYMAPEQARGESKLIDGQTDLWAVGAILFRALAGRYVHEAETPEMVMILAATQPPVRLAQLVPGMDLKLAAVVDRALAMTKADRWPSAEAMLAALRAVGGEALTDARVLRASRPSHVPVGSEAYGATAVVDTRLAPASSPVSPNTVPAPVSRPFSAPASAVQAGPSLHGTDAGFSNTAAPEIPLQRSPRGAIVAGVLIAIAASVGVVATLSGRSGKSSDEPRTSAGMVAQSSPETSASAATTAVSSASSSAASIAKAAAPSSTSTAASASTQNGAVAVGSPTRVNAPIGGPARAVAARPSAPGVAAAIDAHPVAPAAPAAPAAASSCTPPYTLNSDGTKQWKVECFKK